MDETNIMKFLGVVEQRVHEICDAYGRKFGKQQTIDFGPHVSTGNHTVNVSPPNAEDASELEDSDDGEDEIKLEEHHARPLSVEEMKHKAEKKWKTTVKFDVPSPMLASPGSFFSAINSSPSLMSLGAQMTPALPHATGTRNRGSVVFLGKQQFVKTTSSPELLGATM